jgi:serine/threonine protein kinase
MKYMVNGSLEDALNAVAKGQRPGFWTPTGRTILICGIIVGLEFIHSRGMVHHDIKPENILIDENNHSCIADLGSSELIEPASSISQDKGTVGYLAPELYESGAFTEKIDVFSFGLVLYEVITERKVYAGRTAAQILHRTCGGERAEFPPYMSSEVRLLISRCWGPDPFKRPSFTEILAELQLMHFTILPGVDYNEVMHYLSEVRPVTTSASR